MTLLFFYFFFFFFTNIPNPLSILPNFNEKCQKGKTFPLLLSFSTWRATHIRNDKLLRKKAHNFY